jgi:hypothetical protein
MCVRIAGFWNVAPNCSQAYILLKVIGFLICRPRPVSSHYRVAVFAMCYSANRRIPLDQLGWKTCWLACGVVLQANRSRLIT